MNIWFGQKHISFAEILAGKWGEVDDYQRQILDFCQQWLGGQRVFVRHTSGSTGKPKPIELRREQMRASAMLTGQALGLQRGMAALIGMDCNYIAGTMMLVRGLEIGLEMHVVAPTRNPLLAIDDVGQIDWATCFSALVPLQVQAVLDDVVSAERFGRLHCVLIGGAAIGQGLLERLISAETPTLYHTYGMTETVSHIALRQLNGEAASERFIPLAGVELALDGRGCLTIRGPMTLGKLVVTNDLVELASDGSFVWLGRIDNVINSGGVKVNAEKVAAALSKVLGNDRVFVVGLPDAEWGEAVTGFVEGEPMQLPTLAGLSRYEKPKQIHFVAQFSLTSSGKVDRGATVRGVLDG
ncbi:MAG TPA: hypothetical protein ENJ56_06845 [Anaerolineae bacterium]|nr:hypothetical protein [Anaerolineae bacterium]